jgi:hypothetical protein
LLQSQFGCHVSAAPSAKRAEEQNPTQVLTYILLTLYNNEKVKQEVNFFLQQAMKAQRGSRGIALLFL